MRKSKRKIYPPDDRILVIAEDYDSLPDLCFDPSPLIAGGIAAAGTLGGAMVNAGAKWGSSTYMRVAKEMANYNQQMNEAVYNKYQSPAALMRQYREAGLNPAMMYNQATGSAGNVSAGQVSTNPNDYTAGQSRYGDAIASAANAIAEYQNVAARDAGLHNERASTEALSQDAALTKIRAEQEEIKKIALPTQLKYQLEGAQLNNAQMTLDLELDRQFKWTERLTQLDKQRSIIRNTDIDSDKKRRELNFIDTQEDNLKQAISESKTRQWSIEKGVEVAFGNLSVARYNAETSRKMYGVAETNAFANFSNANVNNAKWNAMAPGIEANTDYEIFKKTGTSPGYENGNWMKKGNYLLNYFMDNIGRLTGAARDAGASYFFNSK